MFFKIYVISIVVAVQWPSNFVIRLSYSSYFFFFVILQSTRFERWWSTWKLSGFVRSDIFHHWSVTNGCIDSAASLNISEPVWRHAGHLYENVDLTSLFKNITWVSWLMFWFCNNLQCWPKLLQAQTIYSVFYVNYDISAVHRI